MDRRAGPGTLWRTARSERSGWAAWVLLLWLVSEPSAWAGNESTNGPIRLEGGTRVYRIAVAATGEYTRACGGTLEAALTAISNTIARVSAIYESELGIRLELVPENHRVVFSGPDTDPYTYNASVPETLNENQAVLDSVIGPDRYDLGIVFHTGEFGLTYIRSVCNPELKGKAAVGTADPLDPAFAVDLVAHEIGHQFGANHTFNSSLEICGAHRHAATAFEPGTGSTVMGYSVVTCGGDRLQGANDPYFHSANLEEIFAFVAEGEGKDCCERVETENRAPEVSAGPDFVIPKETPFRLAAEAVDPDGDALTFCWEQMDRGPARGLEDGDDGAGPLFRSFPPSPDAERIFPRLDDILSGRSTPGERLPQTNRTLRFRVTVRDDGLGVGIGMDEAVLQVEENAGPFQVLSPETAAEWTAGGRQQVRWDAAGTAEPPVSVPEVTILLSTNGGWSFGRVLAERTPNDGEEEVIVPEVESDRCRIRVEAAGNVFFAISEGDFRIGLAGRPKLSTTMENERYKIAWRTVPGRIYQVQSSTNLLRPTWALEAEIKAEADSSFVTGTIEESAQRFFRVVELPER